jgi:Arc/MetJ-type ribon-helix-helix transcriptional regulator
MNSTVTVHVKLTGDAAQALEEIIKSGRAANKTEAMRIAILAYGERYFGTKVEK